MPKGNVVVLCCVVALTSVIASCLVALLLAVLPVISDLRTVSRAAVDRVPQVQSTLDAWQALVVQAIELRLPEQALATAAVVQTQAHEIYSLLNGLSASVESSLNAVNRTLCETQDSVDQALKEATTNFNRTLYALQTSMDQSLDAVTTNFNRPLYAVQTAVGQALNEATSSFNRTLHVMQTTFDQTLNEVACNFNRTLYAVQTSIDRSLDQVNSSFNRTLDAVNQTLRDVSQKLLKNSTLQFIDQFVADARAVRTYLVDPQFQNDTRATLRQLQTDLDSLSVLVTLLQQRPSTPELTPVATLPPSVFVP